MEDMTFSQFITAYNALIKEDNSLYHALAKGFGLSDTAFWILYLLEESDHPVTQAELCAVLCLSKQTVNSALKGLSDSGYIRLEAPHGKNRGKRLTLTDLGSSSSPAPSPPSSAWRSRPMRASRPRSGRPCWI